MRSKESISNKSLNSNMYALSGEWKAIESLAFFEDGSSKNNKFGCIIKFTNSFSTTTCLIKEKTIYIQHKYECSALKTGEQLCSVKILNDSSNSSNAGKTSKMRFKLNSNFLEITAYPEQNNANLKNSPIKIVSKLQKIS